MEAFNFIEIGVPVDVSSACNHIVGSGAVFSAKVSRLAFVYRLNSIYKDTYSFLYLVGDYPLLICLHKRW
jgi:hypothetical protein